MRGKNGVHVAKTIVIGLGLFGVLALRGTSAEAVVPPGGSTQCVFNTDCAFPLVCGGGLCRAQCATSRDCSGGWICVQEDTPPILPGHPAPAVRVDLSKNVCVDPSAYGGIQRPAFQPGVNYPGNDIGGTGYPLPVANPAACDQMCLETKGCRGWTYVKPNVQTALPRCYVKSALGAPANDPNTVSGKR